jgi:IS5 family transposase
MAANVDDFTPVTDLLHGAEQVVYGDSGYQGIANKPELAEKATESIVAMRPGKRRALPATPDRKLQDLIETAKPHTCSKDEHPSPVTRQKYTFQRNCLPGFAKNRCRINVMVALSNQFQAYRNSLIISLPGALMCLIPRFSLKSVQSY